MWYITEQLTAKFPNIPFLGFEGAEMQVWIGDQVEAYIFLWNKIRTKNI